MNFDDYIKSSNGSVAFIQLNDDSIWQVGIVLPHNFDESKSYDGYYVYTMYRNHYCAFIEPYKTINPNIEEIDNTPSNLYAYIVSEELLPLSKIQILCYKRSGIEEYPKVKGGNNYVI